MDDGLFRFLFYFGHFLSQMFLQIDSVLLGVNIDLAGAHQALYIHFPHPCLRFGYYGGTFITDWDHFGYFAKFCGTGVVVLES